MHCIHSLTTITTPHHTLQGGLVYTLMSSDDLKWWNTTARPATTPTAVDTFLQTCLKSSFVAGKWISYNSSSQQLVMPVMVTLAAVLDAIPLEPAAAASLGATNKVFDALERLVSAKCRHLGFGLLLLRRVPMVLPSP